MSLWPLIVMTEFNEYITHSRTFLKHQESHLSKIPYKDAIHHARFQDYKHKCHNNVIQIEEVKGKKITYSQFVKNNISNHWQPFVSNKQKQIVHRLRSNNTKNSIQNLKLFTNLKMRAIEATRNLSEKRNHTTLKLGGLRGFQHFLKFSKKENFFLTISNGPVFQQTPYNRIGELVIFLHKLSNAIRQLLMVHCNRLRLMQRYKCPNQEQLVFLLHGQRESVNYTPEYLKKLPNTAVPLGLIYEPIKDVIYRLPDEGPMHHEFPIYTVENCFQILPLTRVFGVEQVKQL